MGSSDDRITLFKEDLGRLKTEKPHISTLLDAIGPVRLMEHALQEKTVDKQKDLSPDQLKTRGGIPLIKQHTLFFPEDPWQEMTFSVADAIREGLPHLAGQMDQLTLFFQQNPVEFLKLFLPSELPVAEEAPAWTADISVEPAVLFLLVNTVKRVILTGRAQEMMEKIADLPWDKGYCPVCGSFPILAFIRINGQRWLHCACCHHEWTYPRPQCPWCEHESPENTIYLFVEDDKENSAYICEKCRKYLITVNRSESLKDMDPDLTGISLAHLDVILQGKGFSPMAVREWNLFDPG